MKNTKKGGKDNQKIVPLGDRVLVKVTADLEKTTSTGIIIPEAASGKKSNRGKVVAVGEGRISEDGKRIPMHVKAGDIVLFSDYAGEQIDMEGEEYHIVSESSILAIIK